MKILIYSDVHGNLPAFEKMLQAEVCDGYICLGDLVNYAPWSNECVDLACSLPNSILIMGNHEEAFIDGAYPGSNELVKSFFSVTYQGFNRFDAIKSFVTETKIGDYTCKHTILDKYIYPDTDIALTDNYIIGHSRHQFKYQNSGYTLYNAGSVGQNRKYINVINYLIIDTVTGDVQMKNLVYDVNVVISAMEAKKYPEECIRYYLEKKIYV